VHYRSKLNFTWDSLEAAKAGRVRLKAFVELASRTGGTEPPWVRQFRDRFREAVTDDMNVPRAMAVVWELIREANTREELGILDVLQDFDRVLGLRLSEVALSAEKDELEPRLAAMIGEREKARAEKNWARADEIRRELTGQGIVLEDRPEGTIWRRSR
jgi:cysteinyl-tRNA synthetase